MRWLVLVWGLTSFLAANKRNAFLLVAVSALSFLLIQSIRPIETAASAGDLISKRLTQVETDARAPVTARDAGRGNPWINPGDGHDVLTSYKGAEELERELQQFLALPLALASGDFDEDGVSDLLSGYLRPGGGGILALHQGSVESTYTKTADYSRSPFLSSARVFDLPDAPVFMGTGDFDGDGHLDVVATAIESHELYLLPGDGRGNLGQASRIELAGKVTALVTGEINHTDGLTDLAVGIVGPDGPEVIIFEGPEGALRTKPEAFTLSAPATALAFGQLDEESPADLAIGAGRDLVVVHGRDRRLSLEHIGGREVPQAIISQRSFPFAITSIALGNFDLDRRMEVALMSEDRAIYLLENTSVALTRPSTPEHWEIRNVLRLSQAGRRGVTQGSRWRPAGSEFILTSGRVSALPHDDLLVLDRANRQVQFVTSGSGLKHPEKAPAPVPALFDVQDEPVAVLPMRLNEDAFSDLVILKAGKNPLAVVLTASSATFTVANTDDSGSGSLRQAILNANANPGPDRIVFDIPGAGSHTITTASALPTISDPVTIDGTTQQGFIGNPIIELNGAGAGQGVDGLKIFAGSSVVRGIVINRFSSDGIELSVNGGNIIEGNYIGTDLTGTADIGNAFHGLMIQSSNNTVGGTTTAARNVISGNDNAGVSIAAGVTGNLVLGNFIGTDATGTIAIGNTTGVSTEGQSGNIAKSVIGGTAPGARNIISGNNGRGVSIGSTLAGNLVQGNFIGTDVTGSVAVGNLSDGVLINFGALNNLIGGTTSAARNVISGNGGNGVRSDYHPNTVQGNFVGTQVNGVSPLGNGSNGVFINFVSGNTIGGTAGDAGNIIAFNGGDGVLVVTGTANAISSNTIFSNTGLSINLDRDGATPNDPCDGDSGANNRQNFPLITSVNSSGGSTTIQGTLDSAPSVTFRIEFFSSSGCSPSGLSEGENYIGSATVTTGSSCSASFTITLPITVSSSSIITATVIDPNGNTSEFAPCFPGSPSCAYSISPTSQGFSTAGGAGSVSVATSNGCGWTAVSNAGWIIVTSSDSGSGNNIVSYSVGENFTSDSRAGTLSIAGQAFSVTQAGNCTFSISPTGKSLGGGGGTGTVNVMVSGACNWTAVSNASWITINSGITGSGNGTVFYSVARTDSPRSGTMTIAGQTFTVKQKRR